MASRLDQIVDSVRRRVSETRSQTALCEFERRAEEHQPRGFRRALQARANDGIAIIGELKKASPSRGLIRADFDPKSIAIELVQAGASALSVLTDEEFFQGSLANLSIASRAGGVACLRKDFIIEEFQLVEARAYGADAVLLIVAALEAEELSRLARRARELELDVLCEVHEETELKRALDAGCDLIGVNSRDLRTFQVDLNTALRLGRLIPKEVVGVAESGIRSGQDITRLRAEGYHAFLIGESLMQADRPGEALRALLTEARTTVSSF
jgi:indole-3-glycerol phosphate synthase